MHPILAQRGRLALYLIGWAPLAVLFTAWFALRGELDWGRAALVALPLALVAAYSSLASWYLCQRFPVRSSPPLTAFGAHLTAALVSSGLWVFLGWSWSALLSNAPGFAELGQRFSELQSTIFALGVPLYLIAVGVHYVILASEEASAAEARAIDLRLMAREAELKALRSQLDPHFLFNSLNVVGALAGSDPAGARRMALVLAEFLRRSLKAGELEAVPLGEELALAAAYLAVERVRFGDRLSVEEIIDPAVRDVLVPPLLLQPLVENAVRHGIAELLEGGAIHISAARDGNLVRVVIENPCDPERRASSGHGVGLRNVAARLAARWGEEASFAAIPTQGSYRATIEIPHHGIGPAVSSSR